MALAGATALTILDTELKEQPDDGSSTLAELAEGTAVELGPREGAWYTASTGHESGWLRMLNVRMAGGERPGDSGLGSLLQVGRSDATVTTGVRGLTVEDLQNAREDHAALQQMAAMQPPAEAIDEFASAGQLVAGEVDDPEPPGTRRRGR